MKPLFGKIISFRDKFIPYGALIGNKYPHSGKIYSECPPHLFGWALFQITAIILNKTINILNSKTKAQSTKL